MATKASTTVQADKASAKKSLFEDSDNGSSSSDDDQEDGGATLASSAQPQLKINEEYARRFEHNKKREELHRLQEKYADDESESSSEDESEDDEAVLVTEDLDAEISATLQAIKRKDPRIYDKEAVFYKPFDPAAAPAKEKGDKPLFLRDYHRERYLAGDVGDDEPDNNTAAPKSYAQEQADLKQAILSEINAAAAADDEEWSDDDAFIKPVKKEEVAAAPPAANGVHPSRQAAIELTELDVANADKNPEEFLTKFMNSKAWAPPEGNRWQAFESDDGDSDADDLADQFEAAYNMRFEDPTKSNEFLKTYSRNAAAARSVRKEELTGRKRQRALEKEKKEAEKNQREAERARLRRLKIEETAEKLAKIKKAAGASAKFLTDDEWIKFLDDAWEDDKWEDEMKKRFGDDYYAQPDEGSGSEDDEDDSSDKKRKPKKPKWDDDIDIKDIIPDFEDDEKPAVVLSDMEQDQQEEQEDANSDLSSDDEDRPSKKRKTAKDIKKEKLAAKREARAQLAKIEALVDTKMAVDEPRIGSSSKKPTTFRYRETSPTTFGLTARDILLAPSDAALNEFAGLKKLATFRDAEKKRKDKKRLGKKARLREWRRETFGREFEETGPTFGFEGMLERAGTSGKVLDRGESSRAAAPKEKRKRDVDEGEDKGEPVDGVIDGERKKKRKRSKGKGKKQAEGVEA